MKSALTAAGPGLTDASRPATRFAFPPIQTRDAPTRRPPREQAERLEARIIYEDAELLALNKPAGLAVHGGSGLSWGVIELLRAAAPGFRLPGAGYTAWTGRPAAACWSRNAVRACAGFTRSFGDGEVRKQYVALLCGRLRGEQRYVDAPLLTSARRGGERHVEVDPAGKPARSRFYPRRRFRSLTLADVVIETGRTHQIRAHAASIGHPVAGDERYGVGAERAARRFGLQRLFLHADCLKF